MKPETKSLILKITWGLLALVFLAIVGWSVYYMNQFKTYKDQEHHFSIVYPKAWIVKERYLGTLVTFARPKQTALDVFQPNANITVQEVPAEIATLKSFSDTITNQMKAVFEKNITIVKDEEFTFGGRRGHYLMVVAPKPQNLTAIFVWTIKGSVGYIYTFMSRIDQYKELAPAVDQMISSFEFK